MKRIVRVSVICFLLVALVVSCNQNGQGTSEQNEEAKNTGATAVKEALLEPVTLHFVGPLTGSDGPTGRACANASELAVKQANDLGGICGGRQIKFTANDTKADPKEGASVANIICNDTSAMGAVADCNSSVALSEAPIFNECKISQINYYAAAPDIPKKGGSYTFRVYPPGENQALFIADWVINQDGYKKIAVVYENSDYGNGLFNTFSEAAKNNGGEIVVAEAVPIDQTDVSAVISKFKASNPSVVVEFVSFQLGAYWAMQSKNLDFDVPVYAADGVLVPEIISLGGDAVEGVRTVAAYAIDSTDEKVSKFVTDYKAAYGENPSNAGGYAYDATQALINAMNAVNCESREAVRQWLDDNMVDIKGVTGVITLVDRERSFAPGMYTKMEIKNGAFVEIK